MLDFRGVILVDYLSQLNIDTGGFDAAQKNPKRAISLYY